MISPLQSISQPWTVKTPQKSSNGGGITDKGSHDCDDPEVVKKVGTGGIKSGLVFNNFNVQMGYHGHSQTIRNNYLSRFDHLTLVPGIEFEKIVLANDDLNFSKKSYFDVVITVTGRHPHHKQTV